MARTQKSTSDEHLSKIERDPAPERIDPRRAHLDHLQRTAGNRATAQMVGPAAGLTVGAADDHFEREADSVADQVVRALQRSTDARAAKTTSPDEGRVQRREDGSVGLEGGPVDQGFERSLSSARSGGAALDEPVRHSMEDAFGADFSGVKVHEGAQSTELNESISAKAFTVGSDIFFRDGMPDAGSTSGQKLLAHELTHTIQQGGSASRKVDRSTEVVQREFEAVSGEDETLAWNIASELRDEVEREVTKYAYSGMGGGGTNILRSKEVRKFRGAVKTTAREQAFSDVVAESGKNAAPDATSDYQEMIGGNLAYGNAKKTVDQQLKTEAEGLVDERQLSDIMRAAKRAALQSFEAKPGDKGKAKTAAKDATKKLRDDLKLDVQAKKNKVVGKQDGDQAWAMTPEGGAVAKRAADKVKDDGVGKRSLEEAIDAPSMNVGLRILGKIIDNVITGSGETIDLMVEFNIPAGNGITVVIGMSGTAARGTDGAVTAGVSKLGNPKRVEIQAKFSVGVGADAIGAKGSGTIGFFVRAGSDAGAAGAIESLSYAAYRAAGVWDGFADLWAPDDKVSAANKKKQQGPVRTKRQRAEMWAAMVEQKRFMGDNTEGNFADIGASLDVAGGANIEAAKLEGGAGIAGWSHYDKDSMADTLGSRVGARVTSDADAKQRRKDAKGAKQAAFQINVKAGVKILGQGVEFTGSFSFQNTKNWGGEIAAAIGMPPGTDPATLTEKIMGGWINGLGEMLKKIRDGVAKQEEDDSSGMPGMLAQMPADTATVFNATLEGQLSQAISKLGSVEQAKSGFSSTLGSTAPTGADAMESVAKASASSSLQIALLFGRNGGAPDVRLEVRSKRGIELTAGSPVKFAATKTTRLLALGTEGGDDGQKLVGEVLGGRL